MSLLEEVKKVLLAVEGVEEVRMGKELWGEGTPGAERGGDLVAVSEEDAWFTYYYWMDDAVAPDYAAVSISTASRVMIPWSFSLIPRSRTQKSKPQNSF